MSDSVEPRTLLGHAVIALDARDLVARAEDQRNPPLGQA